MTTSLVLTDDHPIVLAGLTHLFLSVPGFEVRATCSDNKEVTAALLLHRPDIFLFDPFMKRMDGLGILRWIRQENLSTRVVAFPANVNAEMALALIRLGVRGVVLKEMPTELLIYCVRKVHAGGQWLEKSSVGLALDKLMKRDSELEHISQLLTLRQIELLKLAAKGHSNSDIAQQLYISEGTVKVHMHRIYHKLKLKSRVELTLFAKEGGLV